MANKVFGIGSDDPLSLGTTYELSQVATRNGGDWETIYEKDGGFLQSDSRVTVHTIQCTYYMESTSTQLARGATQNGWVVEESEVNEAARSHKTMAVTVHQNEDVTLTDTVKR